MIVKLCVNLSFFILFFFFFKQKTAYEMRISDWSSDVCSSDLRAIRHSVPKGIIGSTLLDPAVVHGDDAVAMFGQFAIVGDDEQGREIGRASCRERVCQYV